MDLYFNVVSIFDRLSPFIPYRYPHIGKDHLVKLLKQLILNTTHPSQGMIQGNTPNAADVPTLLGTGTFSLLGSK